MNTNFTEVEVGDYMLNDGTTVSPFEITKEQKSQAIGIVAYLYEEHENVFLKGGVKDALKDKGVEKPHGLVIALNDVGNGKGKYYEWSKVNYPTIGLKNLNEQIAYGVDGLEMTNSLTNIDDFPAFKAAKDYEKEVHTPKNTTGWYLPSIGEWFCMLNNYDLFSEYIRQEGRYWTSSERSSDYAYYVGFYWFEKYFNYCGRRDLTFYVRPVLAF